MLRILKASLLRILFQSAAFFVGLFFAAIAGVADFGIIALMIANASLLYIITGLGNDQSIVWHGSSRAIGMDKVESFAISSAAIQLLLYGIIAVIFFLLSGQMLLSWREEPEGIFFEALFFLGLILADKYGSLFYSRQQAFICNLLLSIVTLIILLITACVYIGIFQIDSDIINIYCLIPFAQGVVLAIYYHTKYHGRISMKSWTTDYASLLGFSLIVFVTNIIQFIAYRADFWIIDFFYDKAEVGIFAQANRFAGLLWIIPNIVAALMIPALASRDEQLKRSELISLMRMIFWLTIVLTLVLIPAAWILYNLMLGAEFYEGFIPLLIMLPGYIFFVFTLLTAAYFSAQRLLWINFYGSLICVALILLLDLIFIPRWGIEGAAISNTIAYGSSAVFMILLFLKNSASSVSELFKIRKDDFRIIRNNHAT